MTFHARYATDVERWIAVQHRDCAGAGHFVYAVRSTGIYCRPGCSARLPRRDNVAFFDTAEQARQAGYRACRRCWPRLPRSEWVVQACRLIETSVEPVGLQTLGRQLGLSPWHLQRQFKAETGLTPKAYAEAWRARRLRHRLAVEQGSVTEAIYAAGYVSSSRFYEGATQRLGMRPKQYQARGAGATIRFAVGQCSLGAILVAQSERGICAILLGDEPEPLLQQLQDLFAEAVLVGGDGEFEKQVAEVVGFVEQPAVGLHLPLDIRGTAFQERVWQLLRQIPAGRRLSYGELAERLGMPGAVRAVVGACAANRIAVGIPCHRVVRRDGQISGYRWGVERKQLLLEREDGHS
ncbi:bifunctional DNA-binding transcriptional regulator/O6-methylguanine-DNA methyltransferase Ada [Pseudomonas fulva]|nr:bifunctional DNA-binding transcriptional regulator/O6-methylguanine-DNA methyltransferase Ada [Pseudomonas fulva]MBF8779438.1 bifunctional DNA-binding transcriptional regulator/O6-methylguanine-DNA methyltransferase Ada [Pseudomonas fulva]